MKIKKHWITIYPPSKEIGSEEIIPAKVNWSALGSVSPEDAIQFAHALIDAAQEAAELNKAKWTPAIPTLVREIVTLEFGAGTLIGAACRYALEYATAIGRHVHFSFNGVEIEAVDGLTVDAMMTNYGRKLKEAQDRRSK